MADPLFGLLILDRDPFTFADFPGLFQAWLGEAGGFVFAGLCVYLLYAILGAKSPSAKERLNVPSLMLFTAVAALLCYAGYLALLMSVKPEDAPTPEGASFVKYKPPIFAKKPVDLP